MSLPPEFVAKYKPLGRGLFMDTWMDTMTKDELLAVIGFMHSEHDAHQLQARHDFNFAMDIAKAAIRRW